MQEIAGLLHDEQLIARDERRSQRFRHRGHPIATEDHRLPGREVLESRAHVRSVRAAVDTVTACRLTTVCTAAAAVGPDSPSVTRGVADGHFVYAVGDRATGECVLVDPACAVDDLIDNTIESDGMTVGGVVATHYHPDHVIGSMAGYTIEGVSRLLERVECAMSARTYRLPLR